MAANLKISVEETQGPDNGLVVSREVTDKFIQVLVLSPNGISEMNAAVPGVVQSSDNLGEIRLEREQNRLVVVYPHLLPVQGGIHLGQNPSPGPDGGGNL